MRWHSETTEQWSERCKEWHEVFAWVPHKDRTNGYRMWFEKVLRRLSKGPSPSRWDWRPITILESDLKSQATLDAEKTIPTPSTHPIRRKKPSLP